MGEKLRSKDPEDMPGPGNYESKSHAQDGPKYSMQDRRDQKYNENPGPGQYEAKDFKAPGVKIGEKLRSKEPEDQPGPGNYDQRSKLTEGPKYSMQSKRDTKYNQNPGPGQYEAGEE